MEFKRWRNLGEILPEEVEEFIGSFFEREELLREVEEFAKKEKVPILLPSSAQVLRLIVSLKKPRKVLEIGTGIGYSTLNIYLAHPEAEITTVDSNIKRLKVAEGFFKRAGIPVETVEADGLDFLREALSEGRKYDFIFVDSAKGEYPFFNYKVQALLKPGGLALFDNVLFRGYVAGREHDGRYKRGVKLLKHFLKYIKEYPNFRAYLIGVGDGLLLLENLGYNRR
ncbi:O-methyltransferase [Thermovibrio sp.]